MYVVNAGGRLGVGHAAVTEWLLPAFVITFCTCSVLVRNCFWTKYSDFKLACFLEEKKGSPSLSWKSGEFPTHDFCPSDRQGATKQGDPEVVNLRGVQGSAPEK